jgi:hypothetical protein
MCSITITKNQFSLYGLCEISSIVRDNYDYDDDEEEWQEDEIGVWLMGTHFESNK